MSFASMINKVSVQQDKNSRIFTSFSANNEVRYSRTPTVYSMSFDYLTLISARPVSFFIIAPFILLLIKFSNFSDVISV